MWAARSHLSPLSDTPKILKGVRDGCASLNTINPSLIIIPTYIHRSLVHAMVDTGATHTLITRSLLKTLPHAPLEKPSNASAILGDASTTISVHGIVRLCIYINNIPTYVSAFVVNSLSVDLILGMDWCRTYNVALCIRTQKLTLQHHRYGKTMVQFQDTIAVPIRVAQPIQLAPYHEHIVHLTTPLSSALEVSYTPDVNLCKQKSIFIPDAILSVNHFRSSILISNLAKTSCKLRKGTILGTINFFSSFPQPVTISSFTSYSRSPKSTQTSINLSSIQANSSEKSSDTHSIIHDLVLAIQDKDARQGFSTILHKHSRIFDLSTHTIAKTQLPHVIVTGDHLPTSVRPYYRTVEQRKELQREVDKLLLDNIIRPSTSPWSSPVILKKKSDGTFRFLVDFRRLNSITKKDAYPQPSSEELIYRLSGHSYFTKLDLKSGYFQIPIAEADKEKTAFVTPDGHYEFNVLPQGLMNAPASFQRVMNNLLATGRWDYVVIYLDDIVIFSHSLEEHKSHVDEILTVLNNAHFKVSPSKCTIAARQIEFLGHLVTPTTIEPTPDKIQAILDISPPRTLSQANRFLGKIGYYRKFIDDFARIAAPLHKVTNKTRTKRHEFYWHAEQQAAFDEFKKILTTAPLFLHFPDPSLSFILSTDASLTRIAGILKQNSSSGLKICYYKSRLLSDTERRYSATEREALAICWCLEQLRPCIGSSSILIETDHQPLSNMHKNYTFRNKRIDNWLLKLQDILPQILAIKYRKGIDNVGPDFLTRYDSLDSHSAPSSASSNTSLQPTATTPPNYFSDSHQTQDTESFSTVIVSPVITRSKTRATSNSHLDNTPAALKLSDDEEAYSDEETYFDARSEPELAPTSSSSPHSSADLSLTRIKLEQHSDPEILLLAERLRQNPADANFTLESDIVFRILPILKTTHSPCIPYLPKSLIPLVLHFYHDHPLSGHFGVRRTLSRIREKYWWPNMRASVQNYVASCSQCASHNISRAKPFGHLKSIEPPSAVFQVLHMDFWGPVRSPSARGNRYVLVLTDNLSKYVIAEAVPNCTAKTVAQILIDRFILIHGIPERLITDNGTHFKNSLLDTITKTLNIPHAFSASYHPQSNGQVERFNATFATQLAKYCNSDQTDWDLYLPSIVYAYNTSVHSTTQLTPYELAFARHPKSPFDPVSPTINLPPLHSFYPYLKRVRHHLTIKAQTNILNHQSRWQQRYNQNRRDISYRKGDLVYVRVMTGRSKLDTRQRGPCTVIKVTGNQNYLVRDDLTGQTDWCHVNQLFPVITRYP